MRLNTETMTKTEPETFLLAEDWRGIPVILEVIFSHLSPADIKTVSLVCRTWKTVVEQPRYWSWAAAALTEMNFKLICRSRRFKNRGYRHGTLRFRATKWTAYPPWLFLYGLVCVFFVQVIIAIT